MTTTLTDLPRREQRGSRARCIVLTEGEADEVAGRISRLVTPFAVLRSDRHVWMPNGLSAPAEAKLGDASLLLSRNHREVLTAWWLAVRNRANTPNWDIASTATIDGREGLVLVEAKAHTSELKRAGHGIRNAKNLRHIRAATEEACSALRELDSEWGLSCEANYQLANRFAWSWKLASLGIPVVLVYLGFLNAVEMHDQGDSFRSHQDWDDAVRAHAAGVVPAGVWESRADIGGTPLIATIRSLDLPIVDH